VWRDGARSDSDERDPPMLPVAQPGGAWRRRARVVASGVILAFLLVVALVHLSGEDSEPVADLSWSNVYDDGSGGGHASVMQQAVMCLNTRASQCDDLTLGLCCRCSGRTAARRDQGDSELRCRRSGLHFSDQSRRIRGRALAQHIADERPGTDGASTKGHEKAFFVRGWCVRRA